MKKLFIVAIIAVVALLGLAMAASGANVAEAKSKTSNPASEVANLPIETVADITPVTFEDRTLYVMGDCINKREQPSIDSKVIGYYFAGEIVEVTNLVGDWYETMDGGYIYAELLTDNYDEIVPHILESHPDLIVTYISRQKTEYWLNGTCIASGDCVTGDAKDHPTPIGLYYITSKQTDLDMYGDPDLHADYFCAFNGLIGYHDASWRQGSFGGVIYKGAGSHGCINCPSDLAEAIYSNCRVNYTYVLILP